MKKSIIFSIVVILIIIVGSLYIYQKNNRIYKRLRTEGLFTVGIIDTVLYSNSSSSAYFYFTTNENELRKGSIERTGGCYSGNFLSKEKYLVVYLLDDIYARQMLPYKCSDNNLGDDITNIVNLDSLIIPFMCADLSWW